MEKLEIKRNEEVDAVISFSKTHGSIITSKGSKYYFLPAWIEVDDKGNVLMHKLGNLPEDLKELIKDFRL